ncbi:MAG: 16S rRNA (cytosine(967)-C(5))-methyltransferase RsmB, partial [Verrucomicrobiae bacterium]|nr:16S rRNA (cytosine(967)-C(5))-methyltransferase RsmB [Verrucomicrobiae bacterium]
MSRELRETARLIAARVLLRREEAHAFTEDLLEADPGFRFLPDRDRRLAHELVLGVVRWQGTLDWLIQRRTSDRPQKRPVQVLLRLGLYQIFWLDRVPDHAAVNDTVDLAHPFRVEAQAGFMNGLLRGYCRERDAVQTELEQLRQADPALGWSHPGWLVARWMQRLGPEKTAALLAWNNAASANYARINLLRVRPTRLIERWREEGVEYDFGHWNWVPENLVFRLKVHPPLSRLRSFGEGWFYVQDPSTLLAVHLLDPRPEERMLDVCAAPGGKTTYAAQLMDDDGTILALDLDADRVRRLRENCVRLGLRSVVCGELPEDEPGAPAEGLFDRVLVDAPCSNTGVMRRRVDLRWRIQPDEIGRLAALQGDLLHRSSLAVKPGGVLVYSTCSLEPEENRGVVDAFLSEHPQFELQEDRELFPPE